MATKSLAGPETVAQPPGAIEWRSREKNIAWMAEAVKEITMESACGKLAPGARLCRARASATMTSFARVSWAAGGLPVRN